jgi:hypothetical protein
MSLPLLPFKKVISAKKTYSLHVAILWLCSKNNANRSNLEFMLNAYESTEWVIDVSVP